MKSDPSNCNFREALIAPEIGLLHGIRFIQETLGLILTFVYQVDPNFVN